jgi:hypothetical protein
MTTTNDSSTLPTTEMEALAAFLNDSRSGSCVTSGKAIWNCQFCDERWTGEVGEAKLSTITCKSSEHRTKVLNWLRSSPPAGRRVEHSRLLDYRIKRLGLDSDKREIKSMLFDFIHESATEGNSFVKILDRLREFEQKHVKLVLALAVLKGLAEAESNNEPIRRKAKKLKTM